MAAPPIEGEAPSDAPASSATEETPMTVSSVEPPPEAFNFAAHLLGVDAFDQPAVEEGKVLAKKYLTQ